MTAQLPADPIAIIYDDERRILLVRYPDGREWDTRCNCYEIRAYRESGENSYVPFYAIYDYGGDITARVPALHVEVRYA